MAAIAKLETPDDDYKYKEAQARNRIFEKTDQNAFDEKLLEQNDVSNLFSEDCIEEDETNKPTA